MDKETAFAALMEFLQEKAGTDINENSILLEDISTDPIDAELFMIAFSDRFDIDMDGFEASLYFLPDGCFFSSLFAPKSAKEKRAMSLNLSFPITFRVEHLVKVIQVGKWFDPF